MNGNLIITDRKTMYLLSNGDIMPWSSQEMYEFAWEQGIRPLDEHRFKPGVPRRKRSGHPTDGMNEMVCIAGECFA